MPLSKRNRPDCVDVAVTRERNLDDREAGTIRRVHAESIEVVEDRGGLVPERRRASPHPDCSLTSSPVSTVASDAIGEGPEYRYGGAAVFSRRFNSGGHVRKAASEEYAFDSPATSRRGRTSRPRA